MYSPAAAVPLWVLSDVEQQIAAQERSIVGLLRFGTATSALHAAVGEDVAEGEVAAVARAGLGAPPFHRCPRRLLLLAIALAARGLKSCRRIYISCRLCISFRTSCPRNGIHSQGNHATPAAALAPSLPVLPVACAVHIVLIARL